CARGDVDCW
nr:immunoglobulin heavy chain junction region [Mus musculus]MBK4188820.1 immunoglobulin heavy chain junction region [Mus musculus]